MQDILFDASAIALAKWFHETYEELAPEFGYDTREVTKVAWDAIPDTSPNKQLMIAVCRKLLASDFIQYTNSIDTTTFGGSQELRTSE